MTSFALHDTSRVPVAAVDRPALGDGDAEIVSRSQAGDVQAFNLLVERYQRTVYAVCFRMLGEADAADVTQEAFLTVFQKIHTYKGGSFVAWLLRIASNKCLDHLRARRRWPQVSLDTPSDEVGTRLEARDPGESPDQRVLRAELAQDIERKLLDLPADQRLAVILSDIEGYSYEEIVVATGWPIGTVKSRLSRGRASLRAALGSPLGREPDQRMARFETHRDARI